MLIYFKGLIKENYSLIIFFLTFFSLYHSFVKQSFRKNFLWFSIVFQITSILNNLIEVFLNYFNLSCCISLILLDFDKRWINLWKPILNLSLELVTLQWVYKYLCIQINFKFLLNLFNYFFWFLCSVYFTT